MEKAKPVDIWVRVSTEDQAKGESLEHHEKRAHFCAELKGWPIFSKDPCQGSGSR